VAGYFKLHKQIQRSSEITGKVKEVIQMSTLPLPSNSNGD
jgi:hypothetical protein